MPVGSIVERRRAPWASTLTYDAIRHFAWGIGDDNPLWVDPEYAAASAWAGPVAPPCSLYAVDETTVAPGFDGLGRIYDSVRWTWFDVLRLDTVVRPEARLLRPLNADAGEPEQVGRVDFLDDSGRLLARAETTCRRAETVVEPGDQPGTRYEQAEIIEIENLILAESRRGTETRWYEDVTDGAGLERLTKGPLSIMDVVAWCAATQGVAEPSDEVSSGGLEDETACGPQQVAWLAQLVTDWMGDSGLLRSLEVTVHGNPPLGSTTTISGRVLRHFVDSGDPVVEVEVTAVSRVGETSATGTAIVSLPSRTHGDPRFPEAPPAGEGSDPT